ncbi:uncharacterized protein MONBRDRAFT_5417 [Monosiga brevicollis MX1]|uniref:Right handed beta helix domain-containing protein n=1 Tax=Monosiga brevicollis TaxID=81824 RepID=A9UQX5_MONBE|nr:uncharacterized protein MONBRDRAFT_5417 [Monosiga brevicollis MX1]EDQ92674.1 predicted protein [Monosiga brevicollis MX1]|eukprot:XP_001742436.1 hypothetical protein [Monosiga brevicollis MX1]
MACWVQLMFVASAWLAMGQGLPIRGTEFDLAAAVRTACASSSPARIDIPAGRHVLQTPIEINQTCSAASLSLVGEAGAIVDGGIALGAWSPQPNQPGIFTASVPPSYPGQALQLWIGDERIPLARSPTMIWEQIAMVVYESWTASVHQIAHIDASNNNISVINPIPSRWLSGGTSGASGQRYYVQNAREYVVAGSGYFFHDATQGLIFYAPIDGAAPQVTGYVALLPSLLSVSQFAHLNVSNVIFEHNRADLGLCFQSTCSSQAGDGRYGLLQFAHAQDVNLNNITVRHAGSYGVAFFGGCVDVALTHSKVHDVGFGAVRAGAAAGGVPAPTDPAATGVIITDNNFFDGSHIIRDGLVVKGQAINVAESVSCCSFAVRRRAGCGVLMQAANNSRVSHNMIRDFDYTGVSIGWTWNYIPTGKKDLLGFPQPQGECVLGPYADLLPCVRLANTNNIVSYNHIENIGRRQLSDMGCVYHLGESPGTVISNNVCINVTSFNYGGWGYYLDRKSMPPAVAVLIAFFSPPA